MLLFLGAKLGIISDTTKYFQRKKADDKFF